MLTFRFAQIVLGLYAALLAAGGYVGYRKAGSRPSLIAGAASASLCTLSLLLSLFFHPLRGLQLGAAVALILTLFFNYRYAAGSRKFMPAGMLAIMSLLVFGTLLVTILG